MTGAGLGRNGNSAGQVRERFFKFLRLRGGSGLKFADVGKERTRIFDSRRTVLLTSTSNIARIPNKARENSQNWPQSRKGTGCRNNTALFLQMQFGPPKVTERSNSTLTYTGDSL